MFETQKSSLNKYKQLLKSQITGLALLLGKVIQEMLGDLKELQNIHCSIGLEMTVGFFCLTCQILLCTIHLDLVCLKVLAAK